MFSTKNLLESVFSALSQESLAIFNPKLKIK